jgi:DNA polymerase delta subunit 1
MRLTKLVAGDHTRTISVAAPTVGGLMKFAVKTQTCLGCKTPLPKGVFPLVGNFLMLRGQ